MPLQPETEMKCQDARNAVPENAPPVGSDPIPATDGVENQDDCPVLLMTAVSEMEANMIRELLESGGIDVMVSSPQAGGYLKYFTGKPVCGPDLFVPAFSYGDACALLEAIRSDTVGIQEDGPDSLRSEHAAKWKAWGLLLVALSVLALLLMGLAAVFLQQPLP